MATATKPPRGKIDVEYLLPQPRDSPARSDRTITSPEPMDYRYLSAALIGMPDEAVAFRFYMIREIPVNGSTNTVRVRRDYSGWHYVGASVSEEDPDAVVTRAGDLRKLEALDCMIPADLAALMRDPGRDPMQARHQEGAEAGYPLFGHDAGRI